MVAGYRLIVSLIVKPAGIETGLENLLMSEQISKSGILVIGAGGGIGTALVSRLATHGYSLMMMGRNEQQLKSLAAQHQANYFVGDARNWKEIESAAASLVESTGGIAGAVNLAGSIVLKPAHLTSESDLRDCLETNLFTAFGLVRTVAPMMRKSGGGSIVLLSTAATSIGLANHEAISAAKGAVEGLALSAAATYASYGIRINTIAPGLVETPLSEKIWSNPKAADASKAMHPLGRLGKPDEIASTIEWLLDKSQAWITGQRIAIDGGLSGLKLLRP